MSSTARSSGSRRSRGSRPNLSSDLILEAAEEIATSDGLDALTFQAIGDRLGAHSTSIYRHFRDKDELVLELIDRLRARSYADKLERTEDWLDDLRQLAHHVRAHYLKYPTLAHQMAMRATHRPTEFANVEFALDAMRRGGIEDADAVLLVRAFGDAVRSLTGAEASMPLRAGSDGRKEEMLWRTEYRMLPADLYPNISRVADDLLSVENPVGFDLALELVLAGIASYASGTFADWPRRPPTTDTP